MNQYEIQSTIRLQGIFRDINDNLVNPTTVTAEVTSPAGVSFIPSSIDNPSIGIFEFYFTSGSEEGEYTYSFFGVSGTSSQRETGTVSIVRYEGSGIDYLIPQLRNHLGDQTTLVHTTDYLRQCILEALKVLLPRLNYKYMFTSDTTIARNTSAINGSFRFDSPPIIERHDERPIILQASIDIKEGIILTNWNSIGSWRDDEMASSNIQGGNMLQASIARDIQELDMLLPDRSKKLARTRKESMMGFGPANIFEY